MQYLAVRLKDEDFLFTQTRMERDNQNSVLVDEGKLIETIVVKKFDTLTDAINYCTNINSVSGILKHLF